MAFPTPIYDENLTYYKSIKDASEKCGISRQCITANLMGRTKKTFGKTFSYFSEFSARYWAEIDKKYT